MSQGIQTVFNWLVTFALIVVVVMFGMAVFAQNSNQQSTNAAVQSALMAARNDDGRMVRGVFVVDRQKFKDYLAQANVPAWRQKRFKDIRIKVDFIPDTNEEAIKFNHNKNRENPDDLAIKAVKVVIFNPDVRKDGKYQIVTSANFVISTHVVGMTDDMTDDRYYNNKKYLYNY